MRRYICVQVESKYRTSVWERASLLGRHGASLLSKRASLLISPLVTFFANIFFNEQRILTNGLNSTFYFIK